MPSSTTGQSRGIAGDHLDLVGEEVLTTRNDDEPDPSSVRAPRVGPVAVGGVSAGGWRAVACVARLDEVADPVPRLAVVADEDDHGSGELDLCGAGGGAEGRAGDGRVTSEVEVDDDGTTTSPSDRVELLPEFPARPAAVGQLPRVGIVVRPRIVGRG
jgi:hypothetical protein